MQASVRLRILPLTMFRGSPRLNRTAPDVLDARLAYNVGLWYIGRQDGAMSGELR